MMGKNAEVMQIWSSREWPKVKSDEDNNKELTRASIVEAMLGNYNRQCAITSANLYGSFCNDARRKLWSAKIASQKA